MTLISPTALAEQIGRDVSGSALVVCDVRFSLSDHGHGRREYDEAHIPTALFVDLHTELAGGPGGGRHPLPPVDDFTVLLGQRGIGPDTTVVAYDSSGGALAARLWWMLRSIGHTDVAVLDGGFPAWVVAGLPVTSTPATVIPTGYPAAAGWTGTVDADAIARLAGSTTTVVDARAEERYRGDVEPIDPVAGHIPGAINLPHLDNLDASGFHRPPNELTARFSNLGPAPVVYCGSGVTACHDLLAMHVAGITDGRLYPGSWSDWSSQPTRPVATGDPPG